MSGELEAAGAATTAGLAAAAIEGRETHLTADATHCANCGVPLATRYCGACGQPGHVHRTLWHVFEEFLHGLLHFDTRAWRTFPMLVARPGALTRNYIEGQRARYLSPLATFLFTIFLMFFAFAMVSDGAGTLAGAQIDLTRLSTAELRERLSDAEKSLADMQGEAGSARTGGQPSIGFEVGAGAFEDSIARLRAEIALRDAPAGSLTHLSDAELRGQLRAAEQGAKGMNARAAEFRGRNMPAEGFEAGARSFEEQITRLRAEGARRASLGASQPGRAKAATLGDKFREKLRNPELFLYKMQQNAYKFSFLLVPISLPFVALLFLGKRGRTLYDHVVFTLYSLTFVSLLFIVVSLAGLSEWTASMIPWLLGVGIPAHMYFQLKGAYSLGWFSALWRTLVLLVFAGIALSLFAAVIIILGALG